MNIVVWSGWLETLGGGEGQALAAASALRSLGQVTVVSRVAVGETAASSRFALDLDGIEWQTVPESAASAGLKVGPADVFIDATHDSGVAAVGACSIRFVYFPPRPPGFWRALLGGAGGWVREGLAPERFGSGWFGPEGSSTSWYRQTDGYGELLLRPGREVRLWLADFAGVGTPAEPIQVVASGGQSLVGDLSVSGAQFRPTPWFVVPGSGRVHVRSASRADIRPGERRRLGVALGAIEVRRGRLMSAPGRWLGRLARPSQRVATESALRDFRSIFGSYDAVTTNSAYTASWLRRWWGVQGEVIEPPVIGDGAGVDESYPLILSIGRFFEGGHNKKHMMMVQAFRRMVARGLQGWRLALVGGVGTRRADRRYLGQVRAAAEGLPVDVWPDADEAIVRRLKSRASVAWHAAGFGESRSQSPERYEHFGMAVAELMAAGAVPVVIDGGGLREMVRHGECGYRWQTSDELERYTWHLVRDGQTRRRLAEAARRRAAQWSLDRYQARIVRLVRRTHAEATQRAGRGHLG